MSADRQGAAVDDAEARFVRLYEAHYGHVQAYTRRRIDIDTAQDLTAETFALAWRRLDEPGLSAAIASTVGPLPWLYATARRLLANELRAERYRQQLTVRAAAAAAAGIPTIVDHADAVGERDELRRALARLTPRDQEVVQLSTWEGLDPAAGAVVIGCSTNAFTVRLHRARRRLRAALEAERREPPLPPHRRSPVLAPRHLDLSGPQTGPTSSGAPAMPITAPAPASKADHPFPQRPEKQENPS